MVDVRAASGAGFVIYVAAALDAEASMPTLAIALRDDAGTSANLTLDGACASLLSGASTQHHVVFIVDAAAHIALAVVDGFLCDGGRDKLRGWTWLPNNLTTVHPAESFVWGGDYGGEVLGGRWYSRAISVTDAVGNSRAGPP